MILITGAGGLLGANLVLDLCGRGLAVIAAGRTGLPRTAGVQALRCDLTEPGQVSRLFDTCRPQSVIHCAALTDVDQCEADPRRAARINVEVPRDLATMAARCGSQFVYISSDSVFDGTRGGYTEADDVGPVNAYATSKLQGEMAVRNASPGALLVRTNIYGWNMQPKASLAEWILRRLEAGSEVPGFQDVIFCPILVNDLGDVILEMLQRRLSGLFHVSGSEACGKYDFALHVAGTFGLDEGLVQRSSIEDAGLRARRPRNTSLCTARIVSVLGKSMPSLNSGLRRMKALRDSGFVAQLKQAGTEERHAWIPDR